MTTWERYAPVVGFVLGIMCWIAAAVLLVRAQHREQEMLTRRGFCERSIQDGNVTAVVWVPCATGQ